MNICNVRREFQSKSDHGWDTIYVLVDLHNTIIASTKDHSTAALTFITPDCQEVLHWFSNRKDIKLILWTASKHDEIVRVLDWLEKNGVMIDYVNHNPECKDTKYAVFDKKPYFNILIDDRAGFEPETDWKAIRDELIAIGEWFDINGK